MGVKWFCEKCGWWTHEQVVFVQTHEMKLGPDHRPRLVAGDDEGLADKAHPEVQAAAMLLMRAAIITAKARRRGRVPELPAGLEEAEAVIAGVEARERGEGERQLADAMIALRDAGLIDDGPPDSLDELFRLPSPREPHDN